MVELDINMYYFDMKPWSHKLRMLSIARTYCGSDWVWDHIPSQSTRSGYVFWLISAGDGQMVDNGIEYDLSTGDCFLLRLSEERHARHNPREALVVPWIQFEVIDASGSEVEVSRDIWPVYRKAEDVNFFNALFDRCLNAVERHGVDSDEAGNWLRCILLEVDRQDRSVAFSGRDRARMAALEHICENIRMRPGAKWCIAEMAKKMSMTQDHFIRLFRRAKGVTPGEYVISVRIDVAGSLLQFTSRSISDIANELGYCDAFYFSKQFKRVKGLSPIAYRKSIGC